MAKRINYSTERSKGAMRAMAEVYDRAALIGAAAKAVYERYRTSLPWEDLSAEECWSWLREAEFAVDAVLPLVADEIEGQWPHAGPNESFNRGVRYARYQAAALVRGFLEDDEQ